MGLEGGEKVLNADLISLKYPPERYPPKPKMNYNRWAIVNFEKWIDRGVLQGCILGLFIFGLHFSRVSSMNRRRITIDRQ